MRRAEVFVSREIAIDATFEQVVVQNWCQQGLKIVRRQFKGASHAHALAYLS